MALDGWLEYPIIDGSKLVDGTYTPNASGNMPTVEYDGDDACGVFRTTSVYGYSTSIVISTTADGRKIMTPPDGSTQYQAGKIVYYSMYQRSMETDTMYRVSFDLRLVNLAGQTLTNVSRGILAQANASGADGSSGLALVVNTTAGTATIGGVSLPSGILAGDWVHIDIYVEGLGSTKTHTLVIDGDISSASTVSFTAPSNIPNYSFLANGLNASTWPDCPHIEIGNPSIYVLHKADSAPYLWYGSTVTESADTSSAVFGADISFAPDTQSEWNRGSLSWLVIPEAGAVAGVGTDTVEVTSAGSLLMSPNVRYTVGEETGATLNSAWLLRDVSPLEDFMQTAWSTGESSRTIRITESGTYTVTVTNPEGSATASVTVTFPTTDTAYDAIFKGDPVPEGAWLFGQSNVYRTGIATVQSQYSASPRILALAGLYWDMLNPGSEIQTLLENMIDPSTAKGYGLDVWGRIVGIKRAIVPVSGTYLAYDPDPMTNPNGDSWNNAPFNPLTAQGLATDPVFRVYVMVKAMMNIGNGSLADLNKYFSLMFPNTGIKVIHAGTMMIRVLDYDGVLTDAAILALKSIDWVPAGVGWQVWQGAPDCFGFLGSELQPFDQAPFISDSALIFE